MAERYAIPLPGGDDFVVEGPFPIAEKDWDHVMMVLGVMRPGLVVRPSAQGPDESLVPGGDCAMTDDDAPYSVALNIGAPPAPEYVLKVAEAIAEGVRVLNHVTRHHEALEYPAQADWLIRALSSATSRLPQLLSQVGEWLGEENAAWRVAVSSGEYQGEPLTAVTAARLRLDAASVVAAQLAEALDSAASVTCDLVAAEDGSDDE